MFLQLFLQCTTSDKTLYDDFFSLVVLRTNSKVSGQEFEDIHRNIGLLETPQQLRIPRSTKYCSFARVQNCADRPTILGYK